MKILWNKFICINRTDINKYFKKENINHIITLSHPNVSERAIRTIKDEIYKRTGKLPSDKKWSDLLYPILLKYNDKIYIKKIYYLIYMK